MKSPGARVQLSARFERDLRKADRRIAKAAVDALQRLARDRTHPGLNLERIEGETWSIRVTRNFRIFLDRRTDESGELFVAFRLGTHDIYKRRR